MQTQVSIDIEKTVKDIVNIKFDWEGRDFIKPSDLTVANAIELIKSVLAAITTVNQHYFFDPSVYSNEDGSIVVMFSNGHRTLRLYVKDDDMNYRKSRLVQDTLEIDEGNLSRDSFLTLWGWLTA